MKYLDTTQRGKFIVVYGANNIGKSTQVSLLASKIITQLHEQLLVIKYPVYDLAPTGPQIWDLTKSAGSKNKKTDPVELQRLYAQNRRDFQHIIENCLKGGIHIIAEDYIGTGLAWGMTVDIPLNKLLEINNNLLLPDLSILMDGKRFESAIEKHHVFESAGDTIWNKNKQIHLKLAKKFRWKIVNSNNNVDKVHAEIWNLVEKTIGKKLLHK